MEVIALRGDPNVGKSETINIVYQIMLLNGYRQVAGHFRPLGNPAIKDFIDVLERGGIKVGIVFQGDYDSGTDSLQNHLSVLQAAGCSKSVCASRNTPALNQAVAAYTPSHFEDKFPPASTPALYRIENGQYADKIYKLI
ncbi:MAG: hypothetical protein KBB37_03185 [Bacteroidia bacterium]|nr:hypothetical protein [Bacteroidia bacterium]